MIADQQLETYARAYLGQFIRLDSRTPPLERVAQIAVDDTVEDVTMAWRRCLREQEWPTPAEVGRLEASGQPIPQAWVLLAAVDMLFRESPGELMSSPERTLKSAICVYYANPAEEAADWPIALVKQKPECVAAALIEYWKVLVVDHPDCLPAMNLLLDKDRSETLLGLTAVSVLEIWDYCPLSRLRSLLQGALRFGDRKALLQIALERLKADNFRSLKEKTYWLATAFLLDSETHASVLADYVGLSKEKALPLLDFSVDALEAGEGESIAFSPVEWARLIRVIGPVFPPLVDDAQVMDRITQKVSWLFDRFAGGDKEEFHRSLNWLRGLRVMNSCHAELDRIASE